MPYCPKCDLELVDGIKECPKCHSALLPQKEEPIPNRVPVAHIDPEDAPRVIAFLEYSHVHNVLPIEDEEGTICLMCPEKEYAQTVKLLQIFYENEKAKKLEENEQQKEPAASSVFVKKSDKVKEARSSAYSFVGVGAIVIVFVFLWILGIIDLPFARSSEILMQVVFAAMGIIFFFVGINTFRSLGKLEKDAVSEETKYDAIIDWFLSNYSKEELEQTLKNAGVTDPTLLQFARFDVIREKITAKHTSEDDSFIEALCEEIYQKLYES